MRPSTSYLTATAAAGALLCALLLIYPALPAGKTQTRQRAEAAALAKKLGIADLCLFTEARYTRHLAQADWFAAFQEHPASLEHFPSGSLVLPPRFREDRFRAVD